MSLPAYRTPCNGASKELPRPRKGSSYKSPGNAKPIAGAGARGAVAERTPEEARVDEVTRAPTQHIGRR